MQTKQTTTCFRKRSNYGKEKNARTRVKSCWGWQCFQQYPSFHAPRTQGHNVLLLSRPTHRPTNYPTIRSDQYSFNHPAEKYPSDNISENFTSDSSSEIYQLNRPRETCPFNFPACYNIFDDNCSIEETKFTWTSPYNICCKHKDEIKYAIPLSILSWGLC